jgi:hypothetical protein
MALPRKSTVPAGEEITLAADVSTPVLPFAAPSAAALPVIEILPPPEFEIVPPLETTPWLAAPDVVKAEPVRVTVPPEPDTCAPDTSEMP